MSERIVPMIHVPDVRATAVWYTSIGFKLVRYNEEDGEMNWALLLLGSSELMLQSGGKPSTAHRREFDLYIHTDNLQRLACNAQRASADRGRPESHVLWHARIHHS